MLPKVSIITVVFNDRNGFEQTAKSVISQTVLKDIEWIVIDAASTDGTVDSIKKHKQHIQYWVSEPDKGIYDGMNKGVAKAKGEYLLFLNAGDTLCCSDVMEKVINDKNFGTADHLTGNQYITSNGRVINVDIAREELNTHILFLYALPHQSTFIRRKRLKDAGGYDTSYKICADAKYTFHDLVINNGVYKKLDFFISNYDASGISTINPSLSKKERERFLKELLPEKIYEDYHRMTSPDRKAESILNRFETTDLRYKIISFVCFACYIPEYLKNRFIKFCHKVSQKKVSQYK